MTESNSIETKRKVTENNWIYNRTFENQIEAGQWINEAKIWSCINRRNSKVGRIYTYRCNHVPYRGQQCAATLRLIFDAESFRVVMHITDKEHDHDKILNNGNAQLGINVATKQVIKKLVNEMLLIKPKQIRYNLLRAAETNKEILIPSEKQLYNYLGRMRGRINFIKFF